MSVTDSVVEANNVANNVGGILLTDEFGPTSHNIIRFNRSTGNSDDCGITLAGHSSAAVNPVTGLPTGLAGVFDNLVTHNFSNGNGVAGQGAGILLGGGAPFAGVYSNVIRGNWAAGNGLPGVTIHQHLAGDLNGNVIENNVLTGNNLDGDFDFAIARQGNDRDLRRVGPAARGIAAARTAAGCDQRHDHPRQPGLRLADRDLDPRNRKSQHPHHGQLLRPGRSDADQRKLNGARAPLTGRLFA